MFKNIDPTEDDGMRSVREGREGVPYFPERPLVLVATAGRTSSGARGGAGS